MGVADPATPVEQAVAAVARIGAVPSLLKILCQTTGMGFAAVARVTDGSWTACAVQDDIGFGLRPGGELDVETTLCREVREANAPIAFDRASEHPVYCGHPTPRMYGFESYVSMPIVLSGGAYFGNLCAIDPRPAEVANERVLGTFRDFARLIALELDNQGRIETVQQALLEEQAGGTLREQFIAVVAHDLRNPLGSIAACTQILKARPDDAAQVLELADRMTRNVQRISGLVDDLLDFARGRLDGGMPVRIEPIDDLPAAIGEAIDELRAADPDRDIRTTIDIGRRVCGDRGRLQQLVSNLVANALTHGARRSPIEVEAVTRDGQFVFSVHNDGDPIPEASLPRIFDAFSRRRGAAEPSSGLGLGLYIAQQIVKAHGGTLEVTSTEADGTAFTARIPTP